MRKITLVPSILAKKGYKFVYHGEAPECEKCPVREICHKLKRGRRYMVLDVRDKEHTCAVHYGNKVSVVEYEEIPQLISIDRKLAMEGAVVTLSGEECPAKWCENFPYCFQGLFLRGQKVRVLNIKGKLECPKNRNLVLADVKFEE